MSSWALRCESLSKRYRLAGGPRHRSIREAVVSVFGEREVRKKAPAPEFWALRDVSFDLAHGEVFGIVGRNGAGKSTLLKILARIIEPTGGKAQIYGRVGSLLEVGTGFHSELTGRENIFLGGAVLGLRRAEIVQRFDEIVAFAEVDRFLDTPLKHYSSGMQMRLAFAVAAHLQPEILLVDEVLAVGDAAFQKKCLGKMAEVAQQGRTILFVSHNLVALEGLCGRALLLDAGRVVACGATSDVVAQYLRSGPVQHESVDLSGQTSRRGNGEVRFLHASITRREGVAQQSIRCGEGFRVALTYRCTRRIGHPVFSTAIYTLTGVPVFAVNTADQVAPLAAIEGTGRISLEIERTNLMPGRYLFHFAVGDETDHHRFDHVTDAVGLDIEGADVYGSGRLSAAGWSLIFLPCRWDLQAETAVS